MIRSSMDLSDPFREPILTIRMFDLDATSQSRPVDLFRRPRSARWLVRIPIRSVGRPFRALVDPCADE